MGALHPRMEELRLVRRRKLLALAAALDDVGLRARIVEYTLRPSLLRFWDPDEMGRTLTVTCERAGGRWEFRCGDVVFCDAEKVAQPEDAMSAARELAATLRR